MAREGGVVPVKNSSLGVGLHSALTLWDMEMQVLHRGVEAWKLKHHWEKRQEKWETSHWGAGSKGQGQRRPFQGPTPQFKSFNSSVLHFLCGPILRSIHDYWKNCSFN